MSVSSLFPFLALACMFATSNAYPNHAAQLRARDNLSTLTSAASGAFPTGTGGASTSGTGIYTNSTVRFFLDHLIFEY